MAGRNGTTFLSPEKRESLRKEINTINTSYEADIYGTGCLACGEDDDHANLLLCEGCNAEYHTYCLSPPLRAVPAGDWFCGEYPLSV